MNPKRNKWAGADGCTVQRISADGGGYTVALRNLYDFERVVAPTLEGAALDAYSDTGERLARKNGRILVPLPAPPPVWLPDLKQVLALAAAGKLTDIADRAGRIQDALRVAAGYTIHLLPPGRRRHSRLSLARGISPGSGVRGLVVPPPRHSVPRTSATVSCSARPRACSNRAAIYASIFPRKPFPARA